MSSGNPSPQTLVDHFFRHEYGRLVAVLTRRLGVRRLELVEDVVQAALVRAMQVWSRRGIPDQPTAWLHRVAVNLALDHLRRERTSARVLERVGVAEAEAIDPGLVEAEAGLDTEIGDATLRMLFVCCHEAIPVESRVALALRTLCGFSTAEVARALLTTEANAQKRIVRAKERLRQESFGIEELGREALATRRDAVLAVIYLLFNEGYHAAHGDVPIRRDLCDEAIRLARVLTDHPVGQDPGVYALSALLCFQSARFDARVAADGGQVLLEEQDRSAWDWRRIREGLEWMRRSATGERLTRYHVEAAIAWEHCRAARFDETDWRRIHRLYETLDRLAPSALVTLNRAVALAYADGPAAGLACLESLPREQVPERYPLWHATLGEMRARLGDLAQARVAFERAIELTTASSDRDLLRRKLEACEAGSGEGPNAR